MLAVMSSCFVLGFLLSMVATLLLGVAALFMVSLSFALAFAFHAVRGMYLHAERLLAKAGRQSARGAGIAHPQRERRARFYRVILRSKIMGKPLALRQGRALSQGFGFLICAHQRT
jgi:hypothetical protein